MPKHPLLFPIALFALLACPTLLHSYDAEAERLARGDGSDRDYYATVGVGTGDLYGGHYGAQAEFGYDQISLVGAWGMSYPSEGFKISASDQSTLSPEAVSTWRVGLKGYLAGEELSIRPYLAALYGPIRPYHIEADGKVLETAFNCFGAATGVDFDYGEKRALIFTVGGSLFALTRTVPNEEEIAYKSFKRMQKKDESIPFLYLKLVAGMNYRF